MKLHLGCGPRKIDGFIHVDLLEYSHIDYKTAINDLYFAKDSSVDIIYACHVLEHIGRHEYEETLIEWFRVLKPSGVLRLAVPDFSACVEYYSKTKSLKEILGIVIGGQKDKYDYHKMLFDEATLKETLTKIGFKSIAKYDWRETSHRDVDDYSKAYLPHMDQENGLLMSLNIEAIK